jgi:hypothetical protein
VIVTSEETLALFRGPGPCELCRRWCRFREPHHIFARGQGGGARLDIPENLLALGGPWECGCHTRAQLYVVPRAAQLAVAARREATTVEAIVELVQLILRTGKGTASVDELRRLVGAA